MNILHVVNISFVIPYFLGEQLLFFKKKGYQEYIVCSPSEELELLSKKYGFSYKEVNILRKISFWKDLEAVFKTALYIKEKHIDVVTGHTPKGALVAMLAAFIMRVPVRIYFRHGLVYETSQGLKRSLLITIDKFAAMLSTKVVCVSPSVCKRSLEDRLNSFSKQCLLSKGTCNGIDVERFHINSVQADVIKVLKKSLGIQESDFVIGFTGRLVRDKGIIELLRAYKQLKAKYDNLVLLLVGMLEERDALPQDVVDDIINMEGVVNTGYVSNASIENYYALMDLFILPSYREGFPTSVLEASSMNLPIITTKVTGCIDSIIEGQTGLFVEHTAESIANAIELLYNDELKRKKMGENGRRFVVDNFRQEIIWQEIDKLYKVTKD
ncbi:glycosyltransferase family 4 protein [uncultured Bacteroides sp.]|uniref:glycosyltransferase family 4 protein n=1 Tax=uncultured Bacteroides sp. TaxID=162156 RepID=UPI0025EFED86|nr:glycosyltransferase family 4 protein [uncultured Bacteroides sp.]